MAGLFVPIGQLGEVAKELAIDYAGNMRGNDGKHVTFYREVQHWLAERAAKQQQSNTGVQVIHHA